MILEFLEESEQELVEAVLWYEFKEAGLGIPLWRERSGGYRRVNCPVFPYYIPFFIRGNKIIIAAIAHGHRKPGYWKSRIQS